MLDTVNPGGPSKIQISPLWLLKISGSCSTPLFQIIGRGPMTQRWISASETLSALFSLSLMCRRRGRAEMLYLRAFFSCIFLSYTRNFSTLSWKLTRWHLCSLALELKGALCQQWEQDWLQGSGENNMPGNIWMCFPATPLSWQSQSWEHWTIWSLQCSCQRRPAWTHNTEAGKQCQVPEGRLGWDSAVGSSYLKAGG